MAAQVGSKLQSQLVLHYHNPLDVVSGDLTILLMTTNTPPAAATSSTRARQVFEEEACAIRAVADRLDENFNTAVDRILSCKGRIVMSGMGKHGIVASKIAATLASTGTPSFFMHPAEALHGDLGMIDSSDLIIAVSNSGNTDEVLRCIPFFKRNGNFVIAITGNLRSELARQSDVVLDISVDREVCPLNLAPTTSTTAAMVMGDALAVVLLERRGFQPDDFALRHPSGALGKKLLLKVEDLLKSDRNPVVKDSATFREAMEEITRANQGATSVTGEDGKLVGILTDGDLRRIFQRAGDKTVAQIMHLQVRDVMTKNPSTVQPETLAAKALNVMEDRPRKILVLPVVDDEHRPVGMINIHDLNGAGLL